MFVPHPAVQCIVDPKLDHVDPTSIPHWNQWISTCENSTVFHTSNWARVLHETYGYRPYYLVCGGGDVPQLIFPIMEVHSLLTGRRGVSLPFSDYCRPLIHQGISLSNVFSKLKESGKSKKWDSIHLRDVPEWTHHPIEVTEFVDHAIDLNRTQNEIYSSLRSNYRRKIKKAMGHDLVIQEERSLEALQAYYKLHCITRKKHELPPQPVRFFKKIHEHILSEHLGFILLAYHKGVAIAGAVYMHFGKHIIYKYGSSDGIHDGLNGNYLVQWSGIKWAAQNGFETFSLGRTDPDNKGLIQYKDGWGATKRSLPYYTFDMNKQAFIAHKSKGMTYAKYLFKRLPVPLLKIAGSFLYPHIG